MRTSFSTLACPDWEISQVVDIARRCGYEGIELRFLQGEDSLWKLGDFQGVGLGTTKQRIRDAGLTVACVDTSCRFDSPDPKERQTWIEEGERMAALASELDAPGIRVFGDRVQEGVSRGTTENWIIECLSQLAQRIAGTKVQIWLETHGDFARAADVRAIVHQCEKVHVIWDPASAFVENGEQPLESVKGIEGSITHVHIKDLRFDGEGRWTPVLMGHGEFPLPDLKRSLLRMKYEGFVSFEWEKKWHPEIQPAEIAVPHFANWFREKWETLDLPSESHITGAKS